jgi:hypothetical protein
MVPRQRFDLLFRRHRGSFGKSVTKITDESALERRAIWAVAFLRLSPTVRAFDQNVVGGGHQ